MILISKRDIALNHITIFFFWKRGVIKSEHKINYPWEKTILNIKTDSASKY